MWQVHWQKYPCRGTQRCRVWPGCGEGFLEKWRPFLCIRQATGAKEKGKAIVGTGHRINRNKQVRNTRSVGKL
jgi:hypothetical protein